MSGRVISCSPSQSSKELGRLGLSMAVCLFITVLLSGCGDTGVSGYTPSYGNAPEVRPVRLFGVHPLHNPERLHEVYGPLVNYINARVPGARLRLEASRNYAAYDAKLYSGHFDFALPNPYQTVKSLEHGYRVFGKMGDDHRFRGIILVRKDGGVREVADLRGKAVSFPAPTALAATIMPQHFLHTHGLDIVRDIEVRYVGSQESSIMNVFLGDVAAAATWPPPWETLAQERPSLAEALEVRWQTEPLPNNGLVVREELPEALVNAVAEVLFELHEAAEGRALLERINLSRFEPADAQTYAPVREFIQRFSAEVRDIR